MPFLVSVVYHPEKADELEKKYPGHLAKPGVAKLINASRAVYAGPVTGGDINGKKVSRAAIFVFPSVEVWQKLWNDPEVQAVLADAQKIAGPGGVSISLGQVDAIKEASVNVPTVLPNPGQIDPRSLKWPKK